MPRPSLVYYELGYNNAKTNLVCYKSGIINAKTRLVCYESRYNKYKCKDQLILYKPRYSITIIFSLK